MTRMEQQVMGRIAAVYAARTLVSKTALALYALAFSVWMISVLVWVAHVRENFMAAAGQGVDALIVYLYAALAHTTIAVQLLLVAAIIALGMLGSEAVKTLIRPRNAFA